MSRSDSEEESHPVSSKQTRKDEESDEEDLQEDIRKYARVCELSVENDLIFHASMMKKNSSESSQLEIKVTIQSKIRHFPYRQWLESMIIYHKRRQKQSEEKQEAQQSGSNEDDQKEMNEEDRVKQWMYRIQHGTKTHPSLDELKVKIKEREELFLVKRNTLQQKLAQLQSTSSFINRQLERSHVPKTRTMLKSKYDQVNQQRLQTQNGLCYITNCLDLLKVEKDRLSKLVFVRDHLNDE